MNSKSIWNDSAKISPRESLSSNISADVCVIGGGIAGLLIANRLKESGLNVVVVEAKTIGSGQSSNTTAKITYQHGIIYNRLISTIGKDKATQYAEINRRAVEEYESLINRQNIKCDFVRSPACVYSLEENNPILEEYHSAKECGIDCYLTDSTHLPFKVKQALVFRNQAQFNPVMFISQLATGLKIYENSPVVEVKSDLVITEKGSVKADAIVFATHYPIVNTRGMYFPRLLQSRSYCLAIRGGKTLDGMYYPADKGGLSFRNYKDFTIVVGEGHITGDNPKGDKYSRLRQSVAQIFPDSTEVAHWSAQDTMSIDSLPFIGKYCITTPNWYVATGFGKWGMSLSMVSAIILDDLINNRKNGYKSLFSPRRFHPSSADNLCRMVGKAVTGISKEVFKSPKDSIEDIPTGEGKIVEYNGEKVGVYKDEDGNIFAVDVRCTHLGCQLEWNGDEKTWDCPCHGSRFSYKGELIDNPAQHNLNSITPKD